MDHTLIEIWRYAQVVLGISLVIFVHESGHFLAARLCGVRVEVFSLGFGPKLFGWRRGSTLYQIALLPLGGFVKMAGEESANSDARPARDELPAKSVGQRFLIYSGGVLANVLFALVVFPFLLSAGLPTVEPVTGPPQPGGPAWQAGLTAGARIQSVNGNSVHGFPQIMNEVALGDPSETVLEVVDTPGAAPRTVRLVPRYVEVSGLYSIGVTPPLDPLARVHVEPASAADIAGLQSGDRLVSVEIVSNGVAPAQPLDEAARLAGDGSRVDVYALTDLLDLATLDGHNVRVRAERDGQLVEAVMRAQPGAQLERPGLGIRGVENLVADVRASGHDLGLAAGDRVIALNGVPIARARDLERIAATSKGELAWRVERDGRTIESSVPVTDGDEARARVRDIALAADGKTTQVWVYPGSPASEAGLESGDRILRIGGASVTTFEDVQRAVGGAPKGEPLTIGVERRSDPQSPPTFPELVVTPRAWRTLTLGLALEPAESIFTVSGPVEAVRVGVQSSWRLLEDSWLTVKRILFGHVGSENVGGIITISVVSHSMASQGLVQLFFFLCMLSMNLAFLNVLPIPLLDGGHLFFLLIEKIKGSPVSERILGYSQMVGIALILSLMVFATFNDVRRWFFD